MLNLFYKYFQVLIKIGIRKYLTFVVLISSFFCVLIELLGIIIFLPITEIFKNNFEKLNFIGIEFKLVEYEKTNILIFISAIVYLIYFIKSILLITNSILISRLWNLIDTNLKQILYTKILNFDYREFIKKSNSSYSNLIIVEAEKFAELVKTYSLFIVEVIILTLIFFFLMYSNFISSLITLIFLFTIITIVYLYFRDRLNKWGFDRQKYQDQYQNDLKSGLVSFLSIRINGGFRFLKIIFWILYQGETS